MLMAAAISGENTVMPEPRLTMGSRFEDLTLLWNWVEAQAAEYGIPSETEYAIQLCLEEAVSNIIRHGYRGRPHLAITVDCVAPAGEQEILFTVEDQAPPFDPLAAAEMPIPTSIDEIPDGGRGIRLLRGFAGSLAYQRLPGGNRLTIGFAMPR